MSEFQGIIYEKENGIAFIKINRPDRMNAIDRKTSEELLQAWIDFNKDPEARVAILTGVGEKAFCAGADLADLSPRLESGEAGRGDFTFGGITRGLQIWKPIIAAINGYCLAGGLEMALVCDIRIASENATFGLPEVSVGIIPGAGGTQRLPRVIPLSAAMELLLTGRAVDAQEAWQIGLVSRIVPLPDLLPVASEIAAQIARNAPLAVSATKEAALTGLQMALEQGLVLERAFSYIVTRSEDAKEGVKSFVEKRSPQFKGF